MNKRRYGGNRTNHGRAGDEARTRDVHLGKVVLYQLSYTRVLRGTNNVQRPAPCNLLIVVPALKSLNPNWTLSASYEQNIIMKKLILLSFCSTALAQGLFAQVSTASPVASPPAATPIVTATASAPMAAATAAASTSPSDLADRIHQKMEKKLRGHHGITIDTGDGDKGDEDADLRKMRDFIAIPIVAIVFLSIFGAPVLIVIVIGLFALVGSRMRQRTIRMMVEKGQPVPAELLAPEIRAVRRRSDVRRGVIWTMIGLGAMIFFGAVNNWEEGVWSIGLIPFLIGLGYLIVWKLERKNGVPPPPPVT